MRRKIIPYNPKLKEYARELRNNSIFTEILLWKYLKKKQLLGYDFDRQRPIPIFVISNPAGRDEKSFIFKRFLTHKTGSK